MNIELKVDSEELKHARKILASVPGKLNHVLTRAVKEGGKILSTGISRGVTQRYYVKYGDVRPAISISESPEGLELLVRGRRQTLKHFRMTPKKAPARRKRTGYLSGAVRRGNMHKFSHGFVFPKNDLPVIRLSRGHHASFEGLKILTGPSVAQLAETVTVHEDITERVRARMNQQIRYWSMKEIMRG